MAALRRSQIETLRLVSDRPGGYIRSRELAEIQGIKREAAERKLKGLVASGHLRRAIQKPWGPVYIIRDQGREALEEVEQQ